MMDEIEELWRLAEELREQGRKVPDIFKKTKAAFYDAAARLDDIANRLVAPVRGPSGSGSGDPA